MRKRKNAFTLIELMAVIILLGIVALIAVPTIEKAITSSREKNYLLQVGRIIEQAKKWATDNNGQLPIVDSDSYFLSMEELKRQGYIKNEKVLDPRNQKEMNGCIVITYQDNVKQYDYKYHDVTCENLKSEEYQPEFVISGIKDVKGLKDTVEVNSEYIFPIVRAISSSNREIEVTGPAIFKKGSDVALSKVDTSVLGTVYDLVYTAFDPNKEISQSITIELTVVDTTPPVITVLGHSSNLESVFTVDAEAGIYTIPEATAVDNSKEQIKVTNISNITPTIEGTYSVVYIATDSSGNSASMQMLVVIKDTIAPEIVKVDGIPTTQVTSATITVTARDTGTGLANEAYSFDNGKTWQKNASHEVKAPGTVYIKVRDKAGNISEAYEADMSHVIPPEYVFDYKEEEQPFEVPTSGNYLLEGWGAQGKNGGNGGYISGVIYLEKGTILKIKTGGTNGYNGGGSGNQNGGGATTIVMGNGALLTAAGGGGGSSSAIGGAGNGAGGAKPTQCGSAGNAGTNGGGGSSSASCTYSECTQYGQSCAEYNWVCKEYETTCKEYERVCKGWGTTCPGGYRDACQNSDGTINFNIQNCQGTIISYCVGGTQSTCTGGWETNYSNCIGGWETNYNKCNSWGVDYNDCIRWETDYNNCLASTNKTANGNAGVGGLSSVGSGVTKRTQTNGNRAGNGYAKITFQ